MPPTPNHRNLAPKIIFEDQHLLVLSKPAGLLSQGEHTGDENLVDWLRIYLGRPYVGLIHRLDRNTSGLMVVAKRTKSAQRLTEALQAGKIQRNYLAWVYGTLPAPVRWSHVLQKDERQNKVRVVKGDGSMIGKHSALTANPLSYSKWNTNPITLVEFVLETGRSHQIRVQSSHEGFPLLGDTKYGLAAKPGGLSRGPVFSRVALHSHSLEFPHPMSGEILKFAEPLPPELVQGNLG
jgi:23S rRNA pseudouridine1911/1915/1917 synthase